MQMRTLDNVVDEQPAVADAGKSVARAMHGAVLRGGQPARYAADVLHGTWLGHPLHPVLTDLVVGAWVLGAAFDAVGLIGADGFAAKVGDRLAAVGTASALPTALAGLADFSTIPQPAAAPATLHAASNIAGMALYALSLRARSRGQRGRGLALSALGLACASAGAWLGGHLVYTHAVGVDHSQEFDGPDAWTAVLPLDELPEREATCAMLDGKRLLLYRDGDAVSAIGGVCSHAGAPLDQGTVRDCTVECPWHQSVFDLRTGAIVHGPATRPQPVFDARVRDGRVEVRLRDGPTGG